MKKGTVWDMKKKRNKQAPVSKQDREDNESELYQFVYENEDILRIEQYGQYHFRIFKGNRCVDVWPVRKKYWATWYNKSYTYKVPRDILLAFDEAPKLSCQKSMDKQSSNS